MIIIIMALPYKVIIIFFKMFNSSAHAYDDKFETTLFEKSPLHRVSRFSIDKQNRSISYTVLPLQIERLRHVSHISLDIHNFLVR